MKSEGTRTPGFISPKKCFRSLRAITEESVCLPTPLTELDQPVTSRRCAGPWGAGLRARVLPAAQTSSCWSKDNRYINVCKWRHVYVRCFLTSAHTILTILCYKTKTNYVFDLRGELHFGRNPEYALDLWPTSFKPQVSVAACIRHISLACILLHAPTNVPDYHPSQPEQNQQRRNRCFVSLHFFKYVLLQLTLHTMHEAVLWLKQWLKRVSVRMCQECRVCSTIFGPRSKVRIKKEFPLTPNCGGDLREIRFAVVLKCCLICEKVMEENMHMLIVALPCHRPNM